MPMNINFFIVLVFSDLWYVIATNRDVVNNEEFSFGEKSFIFSNNLKEISRMKREEKIWGPWESWSSCSATCGIGKMFKFRYCISDYCGIDEKEARIKPCQMKPCKGQYFGNT